MPDVGRARFAWAVAMKLRWIAPLAIAMSPALVAAHPLGNFTINRYALVRVGPRTVTLDYVVDMAELPAFQEMRRLDTDRNGSIETAERDAYLAAAVTDLRRGLTVTLDGTALELSAGRRSLEIAPGAGGLATLRVEVAYQGALASAAGTIELHDHNFESRAGWREVVATPADGIAFSETSVPSADRSRALRAYPEDMLTAPLEVSSARIVFGPGTPASTAAPVRDAVRTGASRFGDRLTELVSVDRPLTPALILGSLAVAAGLGAMHALTPGHGKTIVGAYLVGARGTAAQALLLGLVVTATHTLGVYALGLGTLAASRWVVPERLFPWISVLSGVLVVFVGTSLLRARLRAALAGGEHHDHHHHDHQHHHHDGAGHHDHDHHHHSHLPPAGAPVTLRSLMALGVSGGLLPCPSALVVMLGAIALGRTAFGLLLIVAFSVGLATVLTGIGLLLVYARRMFDRFALRPNVAMRLLPVASALVISLAGLAIVVEALSRIGV